MQKYVRVEHKNIDKPQSNIKFKISQPYPDFPEGLKTLKTNLLQKCIIYLIHDLIIEVV